MHDERIKHLEFIQNVITRMNTNSFKIKAFVVTIVSALMAIYASSKNNYFILICLFPTTIFWFLDAYYLCQERKFRCLYNDVAGISESPKDIKLFEMRPDLYIGGKCSYWRTFSSITILEMYLPLTILLASVFYFSQKCSGEGV